MKGIYHDLGNERIKADTILEIRKVVKQLKESKAQLTSDELTKLVTTSVYSTGSKADILFIENSSSLVVKKDSIYYSWNVSSILKP